MNDEIREQERVAMEYMQQEEEAKEGPARIA